MGLRLALVIAFSPARRVEEVEAPSPSTHWTTFFAPSVERAIASPATARRSERTVPRALRCRLALTAISSTPSKAPVRNNSNSTLPCEVGRRRYVRPVFGGSEAACGFVTARVLDTPATPSTARRLLSAPLLWSGGLDRAGERDTRFSTFTSIAPLPSSGLRENASRIEARISRSSTWAFSPKAGRRD